MTTTLLVHGMWHGAWCWDAVRARLDAAGVRNVAVDLPMRALAADAAVVRTAIDRIDDDVLLVGHSYGGAVITAVGPHPGVRRLAYLAAFLLDEGESVSRVAPDRDVPETELAAALRFSEDRSEVTIDSGLMAGLLYQRSPAGAAEAAARRLRPVARGVFADRPAALSWRTIPATYVVCTDDRTVAPDLQRVMAARAGEVLEWDSDHSPLASRPGDVAALLVRLAG